MRIAILAAAGLATLSLGACQNKAEKVAGAEAKAEKAEANVTATKLETQADTAKDQGAKSEAKALEEQADATKKAADEKADAMKKAAKDQSEPAKK